MYIYVIYIHKKIQVSTYIYIQLRSVTNTQKCCERIQRKTDGPSLLGSTQAAGNKRHQHTAAAAVQ